MDEAQVKEKYGEYIMGTYARFPLVAVSGKGSRITDINGREYIDFSGGIGVNAIGYGDEEWAAAVSAQAGKLAHISNLFYTLPGAELAEKLCSLSGGVMKKVFFSNSGAEANEGAIKAARKYSFDKYGRGRSDIITLFDSFHGRTITTLSATGQDYFHQYFFPFTEGFVHVRPGDMEGVKLASKNACAIMLESVMGEGGVLPLEESFVAEVAEFAKKNDILLIFDEVQSGLGRTGKYFGYQHFDVEPDIVTCAKALGGGLPIGALMCGEKTKDVLTPGTHASTFGANPICCAGGMVVLSRLSQPGFLEEVTKKGEYIQKAVAAFGSKHVAGVRGKGLMIGIELTGVKVLDVVTGLLENGLIALSAGGNTLRLLPPLVITMKDIDEGLMIMEKELKGI